MPRPQDHYGKKAKALGYPARSVFKLQEIIRKFSILKPGANVLDIGAAPGSFSLFLLQKLEGKGRVTGVDLAPNVSVPGTHTNFFYISGDIFNESTKQKISEHGPFDMIVSDAAPSTTGQKEVDALTSAAIAECVLEIARRSLKKGGNLVVKIFQGGGEREFMTLCKTCFGSVKGFKPQSSRQESFETYYIGISFNPSGLTS
jgi:23S rRNA (uridine2552-2'-O)-methyltransferase